MKRDQGLEIEKVEVTITPGTNTVLSMDDYYRVDLAVHVNGKVHTDHRYTQLHVDWHESELTTLLLDAADRIRHEIRRLQNNADRRQAAGVKA